MRVNQVTLKPAGTVDLLDVQLYSEFLGREFLPFPLIPTRPRRIKRHDEYMAYARSIPDRFQHGDLHIFKKWFDTYVDADIRVECRVQHFGADTPFVRILAHRREQSGYFATQQPDEDAVDVLSLSPYDLGAAIAGTVELTQPGRNPQIVIPEYVPQSLRDADRNAAADGHRVAKPGVAVSNDEVTAYATVQSHREPARTWGLDQDKNAVVWVRIKDDGEYIYAPGYRYAKPMTRRELADRIDRLISEDVASLRESRGE